MESVSPLAPEPSVPHGPASLPLSEMSREEHAAE